MIVSKKSKRVVFIGNQEKVHDQAGLDAFS
jgi:hypothetical protein